MRRRQRVINSPYLFMQVGACTGAYEEAQKCAEGQFITQRKRAQNTNYINSPYYTRGGGRLQKGANWGRFACFAARQVFCVSHAVQALSCRVYNISAASCCGRGALCLMPCLKNICLRERSPLSWFPFPPSNNKQPMRRMLRPEK